MVTWTPTEDPEKKPRWRIGSSRVRWATIAGAAIVAGGTMYAQNQQKKAQQKAAKAASAPQSIDQTTVQRGWDPVQDQLLYAADEARRLYDTGPALYGGGGGGGRGKAAAFDPNAAPPPGTTGKALKQWNAEQERRATAAAGKGGGKAGTPAPKPLTPKQQQQNIAGKITDLAMAGSPNLGAADKYVGNVLEEGSLGGNEVYQDLYGRLAGSNLGKGEDLLSGFLGGKYSGGAPANGGSGHSAANPLGGYSGGGSNFSGSGGGLNDLIAAGNQNPTIPDSTTQPGLFNDWAKEVLGGKFIDPNDPVIKDFLDLQQREGQETLDAQLQDVGDEFEGVGMYGGSGLALERAMTRSRGQQGIADERTKSLLGYRGQGLDLMGNVGGQVNTRDISAGQIASSEREGAANRASSGASAQAGIDAQLQIANRGMDLEAIQSYLQNNQFGIGQLAGLGGAVSADRMGALDAMTGLEGVRYGGLNNAFGAQGDLRKADAADAQAAAAARARGDDIAFRNANAQSRHLDEYLNRLGFFNSAGGSSRTTGTNTNPGGAAPYIAGAGPSPAAAGLAAGLGTYFQGQAAGGGYQPQQSKYIDPNQPWLGSTG